MIFYLWAHTDSTKKINNNKVKGLVPYTHAHTSLSRVIKSPLSKSFVSSFIVISTTRKENRVPKCQKLQILVLQHAQTDMHKLQLILLFTPHVLLISFPLVQKGESAIFLLTDKHRLLAKIQSLPSN